MSNLLVTPPSPTYLPLNTSHSTYDKLASSPSCSSPSSPVMSLSLDEQLAALCDTVIGDISSRLEGAEYALDFLLPQTTSPGPIDQSHGQQHIDATPTNTQSGTSTNNHTFASTMTDPHSSSNSPPDFAFAAPNLSHGGDGLLGESKVFSSNMSPPSIQPNFSYHPFNYHAGSSFSSSGSATGTSFSSADTSLPAISRDFARPSVTETRRPATAGGALVTRPFSGNTTMEPPIMEEGEPTMQDLNAAASRRASESQVPWNNFGDAFSGMSMLHQQHQQQHQQQLNQQHQQAFARPANVNMRPQTSDGVPLASAGPSLPSTSTIASQIDYRLPYRPGHEMMHNTFPGDRSYSMSGVRPSYITPSSSSDNGTRIAEDGSLQFVSLGGPAPRKRPRRRYDEIERLYLCGWNGCEKSYGTLNHLNAHVAMQKHGEKRLPQEFKEMRKSWRKKRREESATQANSQSMQQMSSWNRGSMSSSTSSDFDRRESSFSLTPSEFGRSNSTYSTYGFTDSRPNTAGSMISMASTDSRPNTGYAAQQPPAWGYGPANPAARRVSAPTHISMPQQMPENGFRPVEGDHPTPTPQNPFPPQMSHNGRQYFQQQTLTAPMSMSSTSQLAGPFDQFAFR